MKENNGNFEEKITLQLISKGSVKLFFILPKGDYILKISNSISHSSKPSKIKNQIKQTNLFEI